jgi:hypothetical protein
MTQVCLFVLCALNFPRPLPDPAVKLESHLITDARGVVLRQVLKIDGHVTGAQWPVYQPIAVPVDAGRWAILSGHMDVAVWLWEPAAKRLTWLGQTWRIGAPGLGHVLAQRRAGGGWMIRDIDPKRAALRTIHVMPGKPILLGVRGDDLFLVTEDWDHGAGVVELHKVGPGGISRRSYTIGKQTRPGANGDGVRGDRLLLYRGDTAVILDLVTGNTRDLAGPLQRGKTRFTSVPHAITCTPAWRDEHKPVERQFAECVTWISEQTEKILPADATLLP